MFFCLSSYTERITLDLSEFGLFVFAKSSNLPVAELYLFKPPSSVPIHKFLSLSSAKERTALLLKVFVFIGSLKICPKRLFCALHKLTPLAKVPNHILSLISFRIVLIELWPILLGMYLL